MKNLLEMKITKRLLAPIGLMAIMFACQAPQDLESKKAQLASLREQVVALQSEVANLEKEIMELDTNYLMSQRNYTLVSLAKPKNGQFVHKIDVRGSVASKNNVLVSSKVLGNVQSVRSKNGRFVKQGDVIIKIDASMLQNSIDEVKSQLELAKTLFEKQKALWDQEIGTEVQYLQAKTNKESLEKRLATLESQLDDYIVRAPHAGQINDLDIKTGETVAMGTPLFRVVSIEAMYIEANVSESYIGKFKVGDSVKIFIPSINASTNSTISSIGSIINQENRTFVIEVDIPAGLHLARANQVSIITLTDYRNPKALTIPTKIIQYDNLGSFVFVAKMEGNSLIAKKNYVVTGKTYEGSTEILDKLNSEEDVIVRGYRDVSKGTFLKTADLAKS